jgi:signal transduction histidine kinase
VRRYAHIDAIRTQQILTNLLSNAVKFTQKGEVALKAVYQALDDNQGKLSFWYETRASVLLTSKSKTFKSFSQADSSTTRKFGGTGLGLVISQMITEKWV